jgi:hypothetical protein
MQKASACWHRGRRHAGKEGRCGLLSRMGRSGEVQNRMGKRADARDGRGRRASAPWMERGAPRTRRCRRARMRAWPEMAQSLLTSVKSMVVGWRRRRACERACVTSLAEADADARTVGDRDGEERGRAAELDGGRCAGSLEPKQGPEWGVKPMSTGSAAAAVL